MFGRPPALNIWCPVCNKPADRVSVSAGWGDRVITVECHGETDQMTFTRDFLYNLKTADLRRGVFVPFQKNLGVEQKLIGAENAG